MDVHLHTSRRPGLMAMPSFACPEPDFNMDPEWRTNTPKELSYVNQLHLSQDANFRNQLRQKKKHDPEDVSLFDGRAYYRPEQEFQAYLAATVDSDQKSECSNHKAVLTSFSYI
ncbi:hypothetical protein M422DRAFT_265257 [Sphaerobolus stellatus SS14]|uniref:Uncharacterized protein n=1 Tax=Sphaerobolus stellatus (strain SS14) TaxID=990650 RepID=A0A0C9UUL8_SPHS4|nr:hypothetical protein M422DRAFT_265257 [Sphaerobolus stellatus SS14]